MLSEPVARWMLVLHTALGVAAVGAATHQVLWARDLLRGKFGRLRAIRRFSWILIVLQLAGFLAGNIMYPTYKVSVRTAYLENPEALIADHAARDAELARIAEREAAPAPERRVTRDLVKRAASAWRWFDVKEHWIALGVLAQLAFVLVLAFWDPREGARELVPIVFGLALLIAATLWLAAIIGVLTAAWRAI